MSSTGKNPTEAEVKSWAEDAFSRIKLAGLSPTPEMFALFYYGTAKPTFLVRASNHKIRKRR